MSESRQNNRSSLKTRVIAVLVWAFLLLWLSGMTAALTSTGCVRDRYDGAKKLRYCNISITAGAWSSVSAVERAKRSRLRLEKGIALSRLGEPEKAEESFSKAWRDAKAHPGPWEDELHRRMMQLGDLEALLVWVRVVNAVD